MIQGKRFPVERFLLILVGTAIGSSAALAEPDQIILVRHAERSAEPVADPALSAAGELRARMLAVALADAGVSSIVTTQFRRSRETAQPLADALRLTPQIVAARQGEAPAHITETVAALRSRAGGTVLVVGHSNTVMALAEALGAPKMADLCETSYSHVLLLRSVKPSPQPPQMLQLLLRLRYGAPDTAPAEPGCQ